LSIYKNSSIYLIGELIAKAIPFLLLPYLTRSLGVEGYGALANVEAYIALALVFIGLSQDGAISRYYYFYGHRSINIIVKSSFIYTTSLAGLILLFAFYFEKALIIYVVLVAMSQSFLNVQLALRLCQKKPLDYIFIQLFSSILSVSLTVILFETLQETYINRILSMMFANFSASYLGWYLFRKKNKSKYRKNHIAKGITYLVSFGFPLLLHQISFFFKGHLDRILIHEKFSESELGIYALGFQVASIFTVLLLAINKAVIPFFYSSLKQKEIDYQKLIYWGKLSSLLVLVPSLVALMLPEVIFQILFGDEYAGSKYYTVIFLLGLGLNIPYLLFVNYLFYYGKNKEVAFSNLGSAIVYIALLYGFSLYSIRLIPVALAVSNIFLLFFLYCSMKKMNNDGIIR
jgi:O-antigen/teichoic acid export membrane protein